MFRRDLTVALVCSAWSGSAQAQSHTRDDAKALVYKVSEYLQSHDRAAALAAVNDPNGPFVSGDLYAFVIDLSQPQLPMLAHGVNQTLIGKPQLEVADADGREFNKTAVALVTAAGEGWVEYKWAEPVTRRILPKATFFKKVGDYMVGSGAYESRPGLARGCVSDGAR